MSPHVPAPSPESATSALRGKLGFGTQFLDANLDGHLDLLVANGHIDDYRRYGRPDRMPAQCFLNGGHGRFTQQPADQPGPYFSRKLLGRGLTRVDWNRDGLEELGEQEVRRIARSYELSTSRAAMWHVMASQCWIMTEPQALKQPIETKGTLNVWKYTARQSQLKFHRNRMSAVTSPDAAAWKPPSIDTPHPIDEWSKDELMAWIR